MPVGSSLCTLRVLRPILEHHINPKVRLVNCCKANRPPKVRGPGNFPWFKILSIIFWPVKGECPVMFWSPESEFENPSRCSLLRGPVQGGLTNHLTHGRERLRTCRSRMLCWQTRISASVRARGVIPQLCAVRMCGSMAWACSANQQNHFEWTSLVQK